LVFIYGIRVGQPTDEHGCGLFEDVYCTAENSDDIALLTT